MATVATPRALRRLDDVEPARTSPLRTVWHSFVRRRWFVLTGLAATVLPALLLTLLQDDRYRATSTLLLQRTSIEELVELDTPADVDGRRRINNEIGVIEGVTVRSLVLTRLGLADAPRARAHGEAESDVITVQVEGTTADLAARLTNTYVDAYIDLRRTENLQLAGTAVLRLQEVIDGLNVRIADVDERLATADLADADALAAERADLVADLSDATARLAQLEFDVDLDLPPAEVIEPAEPPSGPFAPDRIRILVAAVSAGLALGFVAAFAIDAIDDTLRDVADVRHLASAGPVLAAVPVDPSAEVPPLPLVRSSDPAAAAYRVLRQQILAIDRETKVVAVTGVRRGSGASTTAANLGVTFAELGDTVVVDTDLLSASLQRIFAVDGSLGLVDALAGESLDMAALPLAPQLSVVPSGPAPPDASACLAAGSFLEVVDALRARFAHVVLDCAPVDAGTDALLVTRSADAVILVTAMDADRARDVRRAVSTLAHGGTSVTGVVVNRSRSVRNRVGRSTHS